MSFTSINNNCSSITLSSLPSSSSSSTSQSHTNYILSRNPKPSNLSLPRHPPSRTVLCLARRRSSNSGRPVNSSSKKIKSRKKEESNKGDDLDEDAFEALFKQLEEDLKRDEGLLEGSEDEISEEELALLERELEEALAEDENMAALLNDLKQTENNAVEVEEGEEMEDEVGEDDSEEEDEDEEEEEPVQLKGWQLRRLAYALKVGRRKTSIKNLAAELCLDRAVVLELLREPPPNLLMMSAALPDKPEPAVAIPDSHEDTSSVPSEEVADSAEPEPKPKPTVETAPIHVLQDSWSAQKRLKKVQVETLENVYRRTKRPTNAMISSIVHVTNLPRRRVVKWFEDKRVGDGVPEQQRPYRRSSSDSVFAK